MADGIVKVALIQDSPIWLAVEKGLEKTLALFREAAQSGAELVVFGESWLGGYPAWLDHCAGLSLWNDPQAKELYRLMWEHAVRVPGPMCAQLGKACAESGCMMVIGVNERVDQGPGQGTLYNSLLTFSAQGELINHHRKLMPTYTEKLVYGLGDGHGLKSVETEWGKVGGLICWEHWMPLSRQAMHNAGEEIHVAVWPAVNEMHQIASRQYAFEGRCYVLAVGQLMQVKDLPLGLKPAPSSPQQADEQLLGGGSCIIGPDGQFIESPVWNQAEIIIRELDVKRCREERMTLDTSGHYQRNDIFTFACKTERSTK
ncbi:MAG: carbon-nitrogen hydrolase family protein [Bacteroidota bacterium]